MARTAKKSAKSVQTLDVKEGPRVDFNDKRHVFQAYATPIGYMRTHGTEALNTTLKRLILKKEKSDPGVTRSNLDGWHSQTDLAEWDDPAIATLLGLIEPVIRRMTGSLVKRRSYTGLMKFVAWANVNRANASNRMHNHPGFHWSGVYYVDDGSGKGGSDSVGGAIEFQDPRGFAAMMPLPGKPFGKTFAINPEPGALLVFPSFLYHAVTPYSGTGERISIAFNVRLEGGRDEPEDEGEV